MKLTVIPISCLFSGGNIVVGKHSKSAKKKYVQHHVDNIDGWHICHRSSHYLKSAKKPSKSSWWCRRSQACFQCHRHSPSCLHCQWSCQRCRSPFPTLCRPPPSTVSDIGVTRPSSPMTTGKGARRNSARQKPTSRSWSTARSTSSAPSATSWTAR